ncbi:hypothetical protein K466DRAFT_571059, partial [Polyporus arcularius HHB13444]
MSKARRLCNENTTSRQVPSELQNENVETDHAPKQFRLHIRSAELQSAKANRRLDNRPNLENKMSNAEAWRTDVNAFLTVPNRQGESTLYSAVNVPDQFELPRQVHTNPANNMSDKALRHMQYANSACPEIPYVLHNIPMNDPLLGRLGPDCGWLYPVSYTNGWGMHDDIRHSWWQLERGLMLISNTLLELDSSNAGKEVYRAEKWPEPSSFRYRDAHGQFHGAATAIRLSWTAMLVLAARCSMAIALWNKNLTSGIPHWVVRLQQSGIPSSWIEALQSSAITDFSLGLRVGVVIQPAHCPWMSHVPFYRLAGCPTFVEWGTKPKMLSEFIK